MTLFVLDTDACNYIIRKRPIVVLERMQSKAEAGHAIVISATRDAELLLSAESISKLQATLFKKGEPIGENDTMIAGHDFVATKACTR